MKIYTFAIFCVIFLFISSARSSIGAVDTNEDTANNGINTDAMYFDSANPLFDADPRTAPKISEYLDFSNLEAMATGSETSLYDDVPPYPLNNVPSGIILPARYVISKSNKLIYYSIGKPNDNGYRYFVNQTHNFQVFTFPGGALCYRAQNYTYQTNVNEFRWLRRSGSLRLPLIYTDQLNIKKQIDNLYGIHNRNCTNKPDASIVDRYHGIMNDGSTCGGFCGLQKVGLNVNVFISRYAKVCYGQNLLIQQANIQFYPTQQFARSPRNEYQAVYIFSNFYNVGNLTSYIQEIDAVCQNPTDYTLFYNAECPFPNQPSFPCGPQTEKSTDKK